MARLRMLGLALVAALFPFVLLSPAVADAPPNDVFPGTVIGAVPFSVSVDLSDATADDGEPAETNWSGHTAWYLYTATRDEVLAIDLSGSSVPGFVRVWTGDSMAGLQRVADGNTSGSGPFDLVFRVSVGVTYRLQLGTYFQEPAGELSMRIVAGHPPANDAFQGTDITGFPFDESVDTTFATLDAGEAATFGGTVWYFMAAPEDGYVVVDTRESGFPSRVAGYTKNELLNLPGGGHMLWSCVDVVAVQVVTGQDLWFQVGGEGFPGDRGTLRVHAAFSRDAPVSPCQPAPTPYNEQALVELVFPLIGDDLRVHYVTLWEYAGGAIRVRLSLNSFPSGSYNVVLFDRGSCADTGSFGPEHIVAQSPFEQAADGATGLTLWIFETRGLSLFPARPGSIYDADGATLAVYRPGSGGSGLQAACADLGGQPAPPAVGAGRTAEMGAAADGRWFAGVGLLLFGLAALAAVLAKRCATVRG